MGKAYSGTMYDDSSDRDVREKLLTMTQVDSRILIDVVGFNKHHLAQGVRENKKPEVMRQVVPGTGREPDTLKIKTPDAATVIKRLSEEEQQVNQRVMLALGNDIMYMYPLVEGYALTNKMWRTLTSCEASKGRLG